MTDASLKEQLTEAMKDAMRAKAKARLGAIRLIQAEIKRIEVDERIEVDDARVLAVLDKMKKQRKDSIEQFTAGGRPELAEIEAAEIAVIEEFMPAALSAGEIDQLITAALAETGASSIKDMGKVMAMLKPQLQGRADMGQVSQQIKAALTS
ncbi:MAG: GatB/YqeY domain-containing protein [Pseudomonadales bacterium]